MVDWSDLDTTSHAIDDWQADLERQAARAQDLAGRLSELVASARSADGLVEVSLTPAGTVSGLRLGEGIRRHSADRTAREILATIAVAQLTLREQAATAVAATVGLESGTGKAVLESFQRLGTAEQAERRA